MATVFRKRLTNKILSIMKPIIDGEEYIKLRQLTPQTVRLLKDEKDCSPTFEVSWRELCNIKPDLSDRLHPDTLLTHLKNQDFSNEEVCNVAMRVDNDEPKFSFSVNQHSFNRLVLIDLCNNIENLCDRSCYFTGIPYEHIVVEYSSPNIAKPFHYGHFRSTIVGNFVANILTYMGHKVKRLNYIGDWGLQYGLLATGFSEFGCNKKLAEDPLLHLYEVYKEANVRKEDVIFNQTAKHHFQKMEQGDEDVLSQWRKFRELSLEKMKLTYERLGINFDEIHGESMYQNEAKIVVQELSNNALGTCESDGSIQAVVVKEDETEEKVVLQKSDGSTLYLSRDLAAAMDRKKKFNFDSMYYVVDSSQSKHFSHLFYLLKTMGYPWSSDLHHVPFGRVQNFSTRKGNTVFLHDILDEAQERTMKKMRSSPTTKVHENVEEVADILGISSLIVHDLSKRRIKDSNFDWEKVLSMTSDSGITLQYCHARLNNIKENCGVELNLGSDLETLIEPVACALVHHLSKFDHAVYMSYKELEPCVLVHYLFELRRHVGRANKLLTVKGEELHIAKARLVLFHCAQLVLRKGLQLLGIQPLNKM